jgi:dihydrofolate reductase
MSIDIVVAAGLDRAIGRKGDVPWHLPGDLKRFKARTLGRTVVMGRRTWESIGAKPLPKRRNIVVSQRAGFVANGAEVVDSFAAAMALAESDGRCDLAVLGGAGIYAAALAHCDRVILSLVHTTIADADTFFPPIPEGWVVDSVEAHREDALAVDDYVLVRAPREPTASETRPPFVWPTSAQAADKTGTTPSG